MVKSLGTLGEDLPDGAGETLVIAGRVGISTNRIPISLRQMGESNDAGRCRDGHH